MDGQTTPTLSAWSLAAAGTHDRLQHPVFLRRAHLLAMRMRCGYLWASFDRIVQRGYRLRLKTELTPTARGRQRHLMPHPIDGRWSVSTGRPATPASTATRTSAAVTGRSFLGRGASRRPREASRRSPAETKGVGR